MKRQRKISINVVRFKRFSNKSYSVFNSMHKVVNIGVITLSMLTFAHTGKVVAQNLSQVELKDENIEREKTLDEIIVTTSQAAVPINQSAKQIQIINQSDIQKSSVQSIQDILNYTTNIDIQQRGVHGVQADISMRGGTFDQTAILLNDINLSNPQTGHYSFDIPVNLSDIDHIEIISGPASLSYGVNAFSGGINIITKKKADEKLFIRGQYGSHNLVNIEASASKNTKNFTNRLSSSYSRSDGYIKNSDYNLFNLLWQGNISIEKSSLEILLGFNDKQYGANTFYSPSYPAQYDKTQSYFTSIKGDFGKNLKFIPALYWNRHHDQFQLFRNGTNNIPNWYKGHNYHRSDVYGFNLKIQYQSDFGISSFGSEIRNEGILSNVLGKPMDSAKGHYTKSDNRSNISYTLEHSLILQRFTFTAGILANYNTQTQNNFEFYPSLNASFWLTDDIKTYVSWNKATRIPTFTDLYYSSATHIGNKDLRPERSESIELGINYKIKMVSSFISSYWMKGSNFIDWIKNTPQDSQWIAQNLNTIDKIGIDVGATLFFESMFPKLKETYLNFGYTRLHQSKKSDFISNEVLNYLRDKLTLKLNHTIYKNLSAQWNFRWQKRMGSYLHYEASKPTIEQPFGSYSTLDVRFNYKLKLLNLTLDLNNIFDKKYQDLGNIPQPGFWLIGGVAYTLQ